MNRFGKLLQDANPKASESKPKAKVKAEPDATLEAGKIETVETQQVISLRPVGKRSKDNFTQVSAYIPKDTHRKVRAALFDDGRDFSELVAELLAEWLDTRQVK